MFKHAASVCASVWEADGAPDAHVARQARSLGPHWITQLTSVTQAGSPRHAEACVQHEAWMAVTHAGGTEGIFAGTADLTLQPQTLSLHPEAPQQSSGFVQLVPSALHA